MSMLDHVQRMLPDEKVAAVAQGQTGVYPLLWWLPYGEFLTMFNSRRLVAVTDRTITVFKAGRWRTRHPQRVLYSVPRGTEVGPFRKRWAHLTIGPEQIWVARRAYRFLERALATPAAAGSGPNPSGATAPTTYNSLPQQTADEAAPPAP